VSSAAPFAPTVNAKDGVYIRQSVHQQSPVGGVKFPQWDGKQWTVLTDWIAPDQALVRPLVEASAAKYAQDKGITPRTCP
jgi:hypothetical protein